MNLNELIGSTERLFVAATYAQAGCPADYRSEALGSYLKAGCDYIREQMDTFQDMQLPLTLAQAGAPDLAREEASRMYK
ncbi:MAG: hypothetical protein ACQESG_08380 [Nanobdellota archaeon]